MQSDRNILKTGTFHEPTTLEPHNLACSEHIITFAKQENGRIGVFRMKMRALVQKLKSLEKCQFSNCSHLIASHCKYFSWWRPPAPQYGQSRCLQQNLTKINTFLTEYFVYSHKLCQNQVFMRAENDHPLPSLNSLNIIS